MTEVSVDELVSLLQNLEIMDIEITDHYLKRSKQRNIPSIWISDCLITNKPLNISKQDDNKFQICYKHTEEPEKYYLVVIIGVKKLIKHITIITTYNKNK